MGDWWCASADPSLIREGVSPGEIRFHRLDGLLVSLVFALSIGVAYFSVWAAVAVRIALLVADHVPLRAFERSDRSYGGGGLSLAVTVSLPTPQPRHHYPRDPGEEAHREAEHEEDGVGL